MQLDPQFGLLLVLAVAGWLMVQAGLGKGMLERRRGRRHCPGCGRAIDGVRCGCS